MKKFVAIVLTLSLFLAIGAVASVAYQNSNADWGITAEIQADGSVNVTYDAEKVNATRDGWNAINAHIAVYDEDHNFTADSYMADFEEPSKEQQYYPYSDAVAGNGNAGRIEDTNVYNIKVGDLNTTTATYPFVDGEQYYIYVCTSNGSDWYWNYVPCVLTYEAPAADDEVVIGTGNYPSTNADFGVTTEVQADGSVIIAASKEAIDEAAAAVEKFGGTFSAGYIYVTIYSADPGFDSTSDMTGSGPFSNPTAGSGGAGRVDGDAFTYKIENSNTSEATPAYSFEEGNTYYVYICANDANNAGNWFWNYEGTSFTYEVPEQQPTPTPTATATATPTATATEGATETAATTEAATTEAAATTAAATGTQSTDNTDDGGDFSVLIYLAAALVAGGGAAFAFRKKNRA